MSLFDTDIVERDLLVRQTHNIEIEQFSPMFFYKWIWNDKGIKYPPRYGEKVKNETLQDTLIARLGDLPGEVFNDWIQEMRSTGSTKHIRRYFKKIIKREYIHGFAAGTTKHPDAVKVSITYEGIWGGERSMNIIFNKK